METENGSPIKPPGAGWMSRKRDWVIAGILLGLMAAVPLSLMGVAALRAQDGLLAGGWIAMAAAFLVGVPIIACRTRPK